MVKKQDQWAHNCGRLAFDIRKKSWSYALYIYIYKIVKASISCKGRVPETRFDLSPYLRRQKEIEDSHFCAPESFAGPLFGCIEYLYGTNFHMLTGLRSCQQWLGKRFVKRLERYKGSRKHQHAPTLPKFLHITLLGFKPIKVVSTSKDSHKLVAHLFSKAMKRQHDELPSDQVSI